MPSGNTSESEYGSDNKNEAEEAPTSPVPSDVYTVLYATSTGDEIPVCTPVDSDDNILPDLTVDESPTPLHVHTPSVSSMLSYVCTPCNEPPALLHVHTPSLSSVLSHVHTPSKLFPDCTPNSSIPPAHSDETMLAAQILAYLADGGSEQPEPEPEPEQEGQVVFEDQTLEEIDIDLLVCGVQ